MPRLLDYLPEREWKFATVANLGCGDGSTAMGRQVLAIPCARHILVDAHGPSLDAIAEHGTAATERTITAYQEIRAWVKDVWYAGVTLDVVFLIDVLEHFHHMEGEQLLNRLEDMGVQDILVFLPLGECPQGDLGGNPYQRHLSAWQVKDLLKLGFDVTTFPAFHQHFSPPVDAAIAVKRCW